MDLHMTRRALLGTGAAASAGACVLGTSRAQGAERDAAVRQMSGTVNAGYLPVETPDLPRLPWEVVDGVKVFRLRPGPVRREFAPGWTFDVWGYNGSMPGPAIEAADSSTPTRLD